MSNVDAAAAVTPALVCSYLLAMHDDRLDDAEVAEVEAMRDAFAAGADRWPVPDGMILVPLSDLVLNLYGDGMESGDATRRLMRLADEAGTEQE